MWKAIPKRRANNGKRSRHGHGCPSPRDKKLPPVQGLAGSVEDEGTRQRSDGDIYVHVRMYICVLKCIPLIKQMFSG